MTLPSYTLSMSQVNVELNRPANQAISLNDGQVRSLAGSPSGAIAMNQLQNKSFFTVSNIGGVSGTGGRIGAGTVSATTSLTNEITITGGVSTFGYTWEHVSGSAATVTNGGQSRTTFSRSASNNGSENTVSGVYRLKVTDSVGNVAYSNSFNVVTTHTNTQ